MKKFLSMVMALAMTLTLVTVGASAKDFTDKSTINYKEAVDVISTLKVVDGYTNGSFNPTATLTRGAAAKIICNMILGPTTASALGVTAAPFKDVPVSNVFAGYIAYCSQAGIINGYGDGYFKPAATVTGYQFMKMLLGALGYDGTIEGFTGNNWTVNVAKLAVSIGLDDGNSSFLGSKAMTREEACLYAYNTLTADEVKYENKGTTITVGGVEIATGATSAIKVTNSASAANTYNNDADLVTQFCEEHFSKLKLSTGYTDSKAPANVWTYDSKTVGTYADDADQTFVVSSVSGAKANLSKWISDINDNYVTTNLLDSKTDATSDSVVYVNGVQYDSASATAEVPLQVGDTVRVYDGTETAASIAINRVVITRYDLTKVTNVDTNVSTADAKNDITAYITLQYASNGATVSLANTKIAGYSASTYVKGAYIAAAFNSDKSKVLDSYVATSVQGSVSAYSTDSNYTVSGTKYTCAGTPNWNAYTGGDYTGTYALYLDSNGYVLGITVVESGKIASDAVFTAALYSKTGTGDYNVSTTKWYAQTVSMTGTVSNLLVGYTTSAGKIVGDCGGATFTKVTTMTSGDYYYVKTDGTIGFTTYATSDAATRAAVHDSMINDGATPTAAATSATPFYTTAASTLAAQKLFTVSNNTTDGISELTAYSPDGSTYTVNYTAKSGYTGQDSDATRIGSYYITSSTQYLIVEGSKDNLDVTVKSGSSVALTVASTTAIVIGVKNGSVYEAAYVIVPTSDFSGSTSSDILFVGSNSAQTVDGGKLVTAYKMDGTSESIVAATLPTANTFYTYTVSTDDVYTLTPAAGTNLITATGADRTWDKDNTTDTGTVVGATYTSMYNDLMTLTMSDTYKLFDIPTSGVVVIDKHETDQDNFVVGTDYDGTANGGHTTYSGTVNSVAAMDSATSSGYKVTCNVYTNDNGATFIYVTEVSK